tara:strand:+ start:507 stop:788 length:282 start_codon:yes stop_codon:yes gene_type:complete
MNIDRLLKIETNHFDKIEMIISNNLDLMHKGDACVSIKKWDNLANEILLWHKSEVEKLSLSGVSKCTCEIPSNQTHFEEGKVKWTCFKYKKPS